MRDEIHSFEEFRHFLSDTLGVAEDALVPEAHFAYDLGIESLTLVELMLQLEMRIGRKIPLDTAWAIETVGEAYQFYEDQVNDK
jgi:acyl carrier protein